MIESRAMGIIFPNMHDDNIPELIAKRTMASVPFAGRYRLIDFPLSGMSGAGMRSVGIIVRQNYQSLMGHVGSGREWDLARKRGGLTIFPPFGREGGKVYRSRVEGLASVIEYLETRNEGLVVMSDCNIACNIDYRDLLATHVKSGADATIVYEKTSLDNCSKKDNTCLSLGEDGFVTDMRINEYRGGVQNVSMYVCVVGREFLIGAVKEATVRGDTDLERDIFARGLGSTLKIYGYEYTGYSARICDMKSYFSEHMRLLEPGNLDALFPREHPIYTRVRDEAPVRYAIGSVVNNSMASDGCIIEGTVENCVLFRGVRVGKDAHLKNCVIMQGGEIGAGTTLENVVADKNVTIAPGQHLQGANNFPVFIAKNSVVGPVSAGAQKREDDLP